MKSIQNLLFDLDGTLVDSSGTIRNSLEFAVSSMGFSSSGRTPIESLIGARQNGLRSIAVTYGFGSRRELDAARPDHTVQCSEEIASLLLNPTMAK